MGTLGGFWSNYFFGILIGTVTAEVFVWDIYTAIFGLFAYLILHLHVLAARVVLRKHLCRFRR